MVKIKHYRHNSTMKKIKPVYKKISVCLIFLLGLLLCQACSKDDNTIIRIKIETNSDEPVRIYGIKDSGERGIIIKRNFETTYELENNNYSYGGFSIDARCKDENTLITIKVWVNGELRSNVYGNKYLGTGYIYI